ncbi:MAG TPA: hypothetical protein VHO25_17930, partial [Polyangiaceae bacterium]|nr:hypothetical protein [Polyangiaceae bacterium]
GNQGGSSGGGAANAGSAGVADDGGVIADAAVSTDGSTPSVDGGTVGNEAGTGCGTGQICFALDGDEVVAAGGGYTLNEAGLGDYLFVKYEMGLIQLSIDIFATEPGTYDASEAREAGKARVYYFDENNAQFMSSSGTVTITDIGNGTVTGSFSATLEEFDANSQMFTGSGPQLEVSDGTFVEILVPTIP